jgi:hypothetical protein
MKLGTLNTIHKALNRLFVTTGIAAEYLPDYKEDGDGNIELTIKRKPVRRLIEAKKEIKAYDIPGIIRKNRDDQPLIVVAERLYPAQKQALKEAGIAWLDTGGNIYLEDNDILLWIDGNKNAEPEKQAANRAFTKKGVQTVFYFLCNETMLNLPYRQLAAITGTALGNIKHIIEGLNDGGFILQVDKKTKKLQHKKDLLERWMTAYQETLKPDLLLGSYRFFNKDPYPHLNDFLKEETNTVWGGEPAAEKMTDFLQAEILTIYTTQQPIALQKKWTLIPDKEGPLQLYRKFWLDAKWDPQQLAPPVLVYADLMMTGDPRCIETAAILYEKYLTDEFDKRA